MKYTNHIQISGQRIDANGTLVEEPATLNVSTCECGELVGSFAAHDAWHAKLARVLDPSPGQVTEGRAAKLAAKVAGRRAGR